MNGMPKLFITGPCGKAIYMSVPDFHKTGITAIDSDALSIEKGGTGFIRAVISKRMGASVHLMSAVGEHGNSLKNYLASENISFLPITVPDYKAYLKVSTIDRYMDVRETVYHGSPVKTDMRDVLKIEEEIRYCNGFLLDSSLSDDALYMVLEIAKRNDAVSVFTPSATTPPDREILSKPYLLILNEGSVQKLLDTKKSTKPSDIAFALMRSGIKRAIVIYSKKDVLLFENDEMKSMHLYPSRPILCAGVEDVFSAALTVHMCRGYSLSAAAEFAASAVATSNDKETVIEALPYKEQIKVKYL